MKDNKNTKTGKLSGVGVALITPFRKNGQVDFTSLEAIVHRCIDGGVDFLVLLGTTAEAPVLTDREKVAVCETVISFNNGRLPLVLGLGGNDTRAVLEKIKETQLDDFSYLLSVAPFYNKPGQKGLLEHFRLVANNSPIPVIAYNIPSRTGVNIEASTLVKIAEEAPNLVAVKEASGNIAQISDIIRSCPSNFSVLSGDDSMTFPLMCLGGDGVISTTANLLPKQMCNLVHLSQAGQWQESRRVHYQILNIMRLLFEQGNPAGVKAGLASMKLCENVLRLPLTKVNLDLYKRIEEKISALDL